MTYATAAAVLVSDHHRKETPANSVFLWKKKKMPATDCFFIRSTPKYWADLDCCVCRVERSTDQVMKPVNTDALSTWVGHIPSDVMSDMAEIAPMLARLGYDPHANPPDYSRPQPMASPFNHSQVSLQQKWAEVAQTSTQKSLSGKCHTNLFWTVLPTWAHFIFSHICIVSIKSIFVHFLISGSYVLQNITILSWKRLKMALVWDL